MGGWVGGGGGGGGGNEVRASAKAGASVAPRGCQQENYKGWVSNFSPNGVKGRKCSKQNHAGERLDVVDEKGDMERALTPYVQSMGVTLSAKKRSNEREVLTFTERGAAQGAPCPTHPHHPHHHTVRKVCAASEGDGHRPFCL